MDYSLVESDQRAKTPMLTTITDNGKSVAAMFEQRSISVPDRFRGSAFSAEFNTGTI
jgi:hypothetical protein